MKTRIVKTRGYSILLAVAFAVSVGLVSGPVAAEKTLMRLYVLGPGNFGSIAGVTWQKMIRKHSKNVLLETVQSSGNEQIIAYATSAPKVRSRVMMFMSPMAAAAAKEGTLSWPKPAPVPMAVFTFAANAGMGIFTNDPSIKTISDLKGRKVDVNLPGHPAYNTVVPVVQASGVWDQITQVPSPNSTTSFERLGNGIVDAAFGGIADMRFVAPFVAQILPNKQLYILHIPADVFVKARADTGLPFYPNVTRPNGISKNHKLKYEVVQRAEGVNTIAMTPAFWAHPEASEMVIYEMVKLAIEHVENFGKDHFLGTLMPGRIGHVMAAQARFHPGARRAYEEAGWTYGIKGIKAFEAKMKK